ncbi:MAG TPA: FTR1 family protein, partial [Gemmatimonadales bacterium]|nr:FTR1 family protein [Gemmatimonadales bacterium]
MALNKLPHLILSALLLGSLIAAPLRAADDVPATVRRVAATAALATQEYRNGVRDGKIVAQAEVAEAKLFLGEARRAAALLPAPGGAEAVAGVDRLIALVGRTAAPGVVDAELRAFDAALERTWQLSLEEIPAIAPSFARGKSLYGEKCASCHGPVGAGDGPAAAALTPRPADLTARATLQGVTPLDYFRRISIGVAGTSMPAYEASLPTSDRWALALYSSTLRLPSPQGTVPAGLAPFTASAILSDSAIAAAVAPGRPIDDEAVAAQVAAVRTSGALETGDHDFTPVFDSVRAKLGAAVGQAVAGRTADASGTAMDAYMAFESVEPTLRAKDGALAGRLEAQFAALRTRAAGGATEGELRGLHGELLAQLELAERMVAERPSAMTQFLESLGLMLREGLEAILIVGAVLAFLTKTGATKRRRDVHVGVGAAILASLLTAVALETIFQLSGNQREALEGLTMVVAAGVLFYVSYWLLSKIEVARWNRFVKEQVQEALSGGSALALASVAFLAVYREGFETVLFYKALFLAGGASAVGPVTAGIVVGGVILGIVYLGIERFGVRLPLKPFFGITSAFLYYMAFVFAGKGIAELQGGGYVSVTPFSPEVRFPSLGIYSTWETLGAQSLLVLAFVVGIVWAFVIEPRRLKVTAVMVPE